MMNFNAFGGLAYGHHFHLLFGYLLLIAAILFVAWAIKYSKKNDLKNWIIVLATVGLIGWFFTASSSGYGWGSFGKLGVGHMGFGTSMMMGCMLECMQDEECHEGMEEFMHEVMELEHRE